MLKRSLISSSSSPSSAQEFHLADTNASERSSEETSQKILVKKTLLLVVCFE